MYSPIDDRPFPSTGECVDGWKYFLWILQGTFFLDFNCKSAFIMIHSQEIGANPLDGNVLGT